MLCYLFEECRFYDFFQLVFNSITLQFLIVKTCEAHWAHIWILNIFYSFSVGIDFRRQNLTPIDVRFWRLKTVPAPKGLMAG